MATEHIHSLQRAEVDAGYCSIETVSVPSDSHECNEDRVTWLFTWYGVILAVFDGHYGPVTSEYAKNHLLNLVHERVSHDITRNNLDTVESTLRTAIIDFDAALIGNILQRLDDFSSTESRPFPNWTMDDDTPEFLGMKENGENDPYAVNRRAAEGTTVLLSLLVKQDSGYEAWTASLGDSDGFTIDRNHTATIVSEQHGAQNPKEVDRLIKEHPDDPDTILYSRVKGQLAITRGKYTLAHSLAINLTTRRFPGTSFGKCYLEVHWTTVDGWTNHSPPYILSNPDIKRHQVRETDLLVFASDGLRAAFGTPSIELGNVISRIAGESSNPGLASKIMDEARRCAQGKLVDDVTILVFRVGKV
ncbi:hypothetical protein AGABI1DRAFT_108329 [Agaricus bisporus var. burnettii JB137-S8]|uniref:PPM-type phosphatase domain-containing protein n=1 Tax=Agaricus bisporus var. burnettii (strain JB137-S8 / ATCC MYA-4627 / FGSC 10392) TaxID=597362 RepID=K5WPF6_AGABU|nr:uncharacterized protein AGABI1DRAFT_108329 [Agaricus bisporus var. burnettii JB137-S8]EKM77211.1 hypothetical protein AGABI1DRAFT_108329 [Agaricus bisporus var. burnettii JB137-S8]